MEVNSTMLIQPFSNSRIKTLCQRVQRMEPLLDSLILEMAASSGQPVSELADELPTFAIVKTKLPLDRDKLDVILHDAELTSKMTLLADRQTDRSFAMMSRDTRPLVMLSLWRADTPVKRS